MELHSLLIPLGLVPAIFFLYFIVGRYEGKFREKKAILAFVIGFALGLFIYLIEIFNIKIGEKIYLGDIFIIALSFSFIEQTSKFMVLNASFLRDDATPIYGAAMGAGYAAPFAPIFIRSVETSVYGIAIASIPIMVILLTSYSAILIAIGIKRGRKAQHFIYAFLFSFIVWTILLLIFNLKYNAAYLLFLLSLLIFLSAFATYHAYSRLLPFSMLGRKELREIL